MRLSLTRIAFLFSLCLLPLIPATAQDDTPDPFLNILNSIPADPSATDGELITIIDVTAIERAYPGTARIASWEEFMEISAAPDNPEWQAQAAWWQVYFNNNSSWLFRDSFGVGDEVRATVGFDMFSADQEVHYGQPPASVNVIYGDFDEQTIQSAFEVLGFTQSHDLLWCGAQGCDAGTMVNIEARNPANPFGGQLGRSQPLLISADYVMSSPALEQVEAYVDATNNTVDSLGDDPAYVASVAAAQTRGVLIQAAWIDGTLLDDALLAPLQNMAGITEAMLEALTDDMDEWSQLPAPELVMLADVASETEQIVLFELVYDNQADAETAASVLPERISSSNSLRTNRSWTEMLEERGVTEIKTLVFEQDDMYVMGIEFSTPIAETPEQIIEVTDITNPDDSEVVPPGLLYRLFISSIYARDMFWLNAASGE